MYASSSEGGRSRLPVPVVVEPGNLGENAGPSPSAEAAGEVALDAAALAADTAEELLLALWRAAGTGTGAREVLDLRKLACVAR